MAGMETRPPSAAKPAATRSAVTNGKRLHAIRPGDTIWARRFADVYREITSDISRGEGADTLSEGQRQLSRRAATLCIVCERMEIDAARGVDFDLDTYGALTDRLGRAFHRLGLKRQPKPPMSLQEY